MALAKFKSKKILIPAIILVVITTVIVLELTNTTYLFHEQKAVSGQIPLTTDSQKSKKSSGKKNADSNTAEQAAHGASSTETTSDKSAAGTGTSSSALPLEAPYGSFVSNHSPNLGGSPAPSQEESVCTTTPSATCVISFTNEDGVVKSLPPQAADATGHVYWTWDVSTAGFTPGTWKITATATQGTDSKSTSDQISLSVKP